MAFFPLCVCLASGPFLLVHVSSRLHISRSLPAFPLLMPTSTLPFSSSLSLKLFTSPSCYEGQLTRVRGGPTDTVLPQPTFRFILSPQRT